MSIHYLHLKKIKNHIWGKIICILIYISTTIYIYYITPNNSARYLTLTGTMKIFANLCSQVRKIAILPRRYRFVSILIHHFRQQAAIRRISALLSSSREFVGESLKGTVRDITRLVKGEHSARDENAKAAFG